MILKISYHVFTLYIEIQQMLFPKSVRGCKFYLMCYNLAGESDPVPKIDHIN